MSSHSFANALQWILFGDSKKGDAYHVVVVTFLHPQRLLAKMHPCTPPAASSPDGGGGGGVA